MTGRLGEGLRRARIRWRMANPLLRAVAQGLAVMALALAAFRFLTVGSEMNETAASMLVAVVFGVATVVQLRRSQRRQHTVELLTAFQSTEVLAAGDLWMAMRIARGQPVPADVPPDDDRHIISMLDYYEFLASLALRGLVDTPLLLDQRGGTMARCYQICQPYIDSRRATVGPELYRGFELLVTEYTRRPRGRYRPVPPSSVEYPTPASSTVDVNPDARS